MTKSVLPHYRLAQTLHVTTLRGRPEVMVRITKNVAAKSCGDPLRHRHKPLARTVKPLPLKRHEEPLREGVDLWQLLPVKARLLTVRVGSGVIIILLQMQALFEVLQLVEGFTIHSLLGNKALE